MYKYNLETSYAEAAAQLRQLSRDEERYLILKQVGAFWKNQKLDFSHADFERVLAETTFFLRGKIKLIRLMGVPEEEARNYRVGKFASWASFLDEDVQGYHLFSPKTSIKSELLIYGEKELGLFQREHNRVVSISDNNTIKLSDHASYRSQDDEYPVILEF